MLFTLQAGHKHFDMHLQGKQSSKKIVYLLLFLHGIVEKRKSAQWRGIRGIENNNPKL